MKERKSIEIKVWMIRNNITQADISRHTRLNHTYVSRTIGGTKNSRAVLEYLREKGCPIEYLELPNDMQAA